MASASQRSVITDKLVLAKTGNSMEEWFRHLDELGARSMKHNEIFDLISGIEGLSPLGQWNQNLLTTTYEWDRGLKERGEKPGGFEISVSKTVNVPIEVLYRAFVDDKIRKKWLAHEIAIRKSTENKSARVTWPDNSTSLSVDFYPKGDLKSQIVVQHLKIPDSKMASEMKQFWGLRLADLKEHLEHSD
ncbi:MAG: hypothetical protein ABR530_10130 [Pyrinomonadaceae bacterium]